VVHDVYGVSYTDYSQTSSTLSACDINHSTRSQWYGDSDMTANCCEDAAVTEHTAIARLSEGVTSRRCKRHITVQPMNTVPVVQLNSQQLLPKQAGKRCLMARYTGWLTDCVIVLRACMKISRSSAYLLPNTHCWLDTVYVD